MPTQAHTRTNTHRDTCARTHPHTQTHVHTNTHAHRPGPDRTWTHPITHTHTDAHTQAQPHRVTPPHTRAHMPGPLPPSDVPSALLHAQDALSHPEAMAPGHPDAATSVHLPSRGRAPTSPGSLTTAGPAREWQPRCGPERAGHEREAGLRGAGGSVGLRQASSRISPPRPPRRGAWGQGQSASGARAKWLSL